MSETLEHKGIRYQQDGKQFVVYLGGEEKRFDTEQKCKYAITRYKTEFDEQAEKVKADEAAKEAEKPVEEPPEPKTDPTPEPREEDDKPGKKVEIVLVTQEGQTTKICGIQFKDGRAEVPESQAQNLIERLPKVFGYPTRE